MLDFIGVGLGPFNLSLAALVNQHASLKYCFFEKRENFDWHAGLQLPGAMLQVPFMADLVSLVEPTSPYSFLNYLKAQQRLYKFYFRENLYIPRKEYNHYCQWVVQQLHDLHFGQRVVDVAPISGGFQVIAEQCGRLSIHQTRKLVLGVGTVPRLPKPLQTISEQTASCLHSSSYLQQCADNLSGNVVLIGSGQSAAEIFIDLFDQQLSSETGKPRFHLYWLTRSAGFSPMENTPLGLESFSPDYMRYFYHLPEALKDTLPTAQAHLYKGISSRTIQEIYERLYHRSIGQADTCVTIAGNYQLENAQLHGPNNIQLEFLQIQQQQMLKLRASTVIAATGYQYPAQTFLNKLNDRIVLDTQQRWKISEHHQLQYQGDGEIYVQNTSLQHHGVGTPDLGLGAFRSARIANQILKENYFDVDGKQGFQDFQLSSQALTTEFQINNSRTNTVMPHSSGKTDDQYLKVMSK